MIRPLALFIGLRYTRAKRRNHFVSFISGVSILGISVGVWALITVLSIMNGFERELRGRILSVATHVTISSSRGWLDDWEGLAKTALEQQGVSAAAPYIGARASHASQCRDRGAGTRRAACERESRINAHATPPGWGLGLSCGRRLADRAGL